MCQQEKKCSKVKVEDEKVWLCESCESLVEGLKGLMK